MTIVDSHVHVWSDDLARYPWRPPAGMAPPTVPGSVELLMRQMDQSGVDRVLFVQTINYRWDHSYVLDCNQRYPRRTAIVCWVDPLDQTAPAALEHLVREKGIVGVRLQPYQTPQDWSWFSDPSTYGLWEKATELEIPISINILPHQMKALERMVQRFQQVKVVVDHLGCQNPAESPEYPSAEGLLRLAGYPNVNVKVSAFRLLSKEGYPYTDCLGLVERVHARFGAQRMLWASEFPYVQQVEGYAKALELVNRFTFLSESDRTWLLGKTANNLYGLDRSARESGS